MKYKTKLEFQKGSSRSYQSSRINGWLDDICNHMVEVIKHKGYWVIIENCLEEVLKYNSRGEFQKGCGSTYNSYRKNGWLDEFFLKTKKEVVY